MNFRKYLIITISTVLGIILIVLVAVIFLASDSSKKAQQISQAKLEISRKNRGLELLTILQSESQKAASYSAELDSALITKEQLINSKKELIALAQTNGINLNLEFRDETPSLENKARRTSMVLSLNGSSGGFVSIANFLKSIENSKYAVQLTSIDLNFENNRSFNGNLNGQIFSF